MAAPAPSPGARWTLPAPLAEVGDAAVESIVDDPRPGVSANELLKNRRRKAIQGRGRSSACNACKVNNIKKRKVGPRTSQGGHRI